jgi:peptide subunit release factor 1 (eRF1)
MKVYELIQKLCESPADAEVLVRVEADNMDYEFEDRDGRDRTIGLYFSLEVEVMDAFERTVKGEKKMVIDLFAL